jgi:hypothetical protein
MAVSFVDMSCRAGDLINTITCVLDELGEKPVSRADVNVNI